MSQVTRLATNAIRVYPALYPTRLRFLQTMFSRYSGCYLVDPETGNMYSRDGISDTNQYEPEVIDASSERNPATVVTRRRDAMIEQWTSENAAGIAADSVHDELTSISELGWPEYSYGMKVPVEDMSKDTRDAFLEVLLAYEDAYDSALYANENADVQYMKTGKTWNLSWKHVEEVFKSAEAMLEKLLGQTKAERHAEREAIAKQLIAEILAEERA
jgi:hypothetical protein